LARLDDIQTCTAWTPHIQNHHPSTLRWWIDLKTADNSTWLNVTTILKQLYGKLPAKKWPLIIFLHEAGEHRNNLDLVKKTWYPKNCGKSPVLPFITVFLQCPKDSWWTSKLHIFNDLVDEVIRKYDGDTSRICLTGPNMGGFGTRSLASMHAKRFARIAPVCEGEETHRVVEQFHNKMIIILRCHIL